MSEYRGRRGRGNRGFGGQRDCDTGRGDRRDRRWEDSRGGAGRGQYDYSSYSGDRQRASVAPRTHERHHHNYREHGGERDGNRQQADRGQCSGRQYRGKLQQGGPEQRRGDKRSERAHCDQREDEYLLEQGFIPEVRVIEENEKPKNPFEELKKVAGLKIDKSLEYATKPEHGQNGRKIALLTNNFMLQFSFDDFIVYHYDVSFERQYVRPSNEEPIETEVEDVKTSDSKRRSRKLAMRFSHKVIKEMIKTNSGEGAVFNEITSVFDGGKNLYTNKLLNMDSAITDSDGKQMLRIDVTAKEFPDDRCDEPVTFTVSLKLVASIFINGKWTVFPPEAIQFINTYLRYGPTLDNIPIGNNIFFENARRLGLPMYKELDFGYYQSARNTERGLMLNIDRVASAFHKAGNLIDVFEVCLTDLRTDNWSTNLAKTPRLNGHLVDQMTDELSGLRIKTTYLGYSRKMRIFALTKQAACELQISINDTDETGAVISKKQTVEQYFREKHCIRLEYPHMPCVWVGSRDKSQYFPLELCELLPDQYVTKQLNREVLSKLTKLAADQKPNQRFEEITSSGNHIRENGTVFDSNFGISVHSQLVRVDGRVLNSPQLKYREETHGARPSSVNLELEPNCEWMMQKPSKKLFYESVTIDNWVLVDMSRVGYPDHFRQKFVKEMKKTAEMLGVVMANPETRRYDFVDINGLRNYVFQWVVRMKKKIQLIVFFLPNEDRCYRAVKQLGDHEFGIVTQCCSTKHYRSEEGRNTLLKTAYLTNVLLKINAKLNGVNTVLDVQWASQEKIMFVGVDVTHPSPIDPYQLSIASCVATYDDTFVRYIVKCITQDFKRKEIVNLDKMMKELLITYKEKNHCWPRKIIVYRDGVAESQFTHVMAYEITTLNQLFEEIGITNKPLVTYIIVQKRHHTRFMPVKRKDATPNLNVPPGTTVDSVITDPIKFDFYICSHNGMKGTSRPSRYWVLWDQNHYSADEIQQITYFMCFSYPRCTKSVSIPVPVKYAHLSAFRARHLVYEYLLSVLPSSRPTSSQGCNEGARAANAEQRMPRGKEKKLTKEEKKAKEEQEEREIQQHSEQLNNAIRVHENLSDTPYYS